jgi:c-di-GMP-binding flagellar brake protein YcgR
MHAVGSMEPAKEAKELEAGGENLRAVPRFGVDEDAQVILVEHGTTLPCHIVDLSLSGCRIRTKERFPAGAKARIEVSFKVRGLAFRFCGMTQWTNGRNLAGVRFVDVSARRKEDLAEAIGEIAAKVAAKQAAEKLAAEQEAAAKLVAEEQAAASGADAPAAGKQNESQHPHSTVQTQVPMNTAHSQSGSRTLFVLPWAGGGQRAPLATIKELSGPLGGSATAERSGTEQRPAGALSASPQLVAAQKLDTQGAGQPSPKSNGRERRAQSREGVDTTATIFLVNVASRLTGRILDLSPGGCRIRTDERFPVGIYTRIETEFRLEGLPFRLGGVIQAIHDRHHVGIRFLDTSSRKREQIEQLIDEIEEAKKQGLGTKD